MRKILFKAKHINDHGWVYGDLIRNDNKYYPVTFIGGIIFSRDKYTNELSLDGHWLSEVDPETVGQYTGLTDKNGKKIFEGDIVRYRKNQGVINYHDCCFCIRLIEKDWMRRSNPAMDIVENEYPNEIEVIGNIHDNPELLEE